MKKISHSDLHDLVYYDPKTGIFVALVSRGSLKVGDVIGSMSSRGYLRTTIRARHYFLHHLAWFYIYGTWPKKIDHRNGRFSDNRIKNLRVATTSQNGQNRKIDRRNRTGVTGVAWIKGKQTWRAYISVKNRRIVLGSFDDFEEAVLIRFVAELFLFNRFSGLHRGN